MTMTSALTDVGTIVTQAVGIITNHIYSIFQNTFSKKSKTH